MGRPDIRIFIGTAAALVVACDAASAPVVQAKSEIEGASLVALASLPRPPETGALDEACQGYRAEKPTALGRQVEKLGWIVTSEAGLGRYRVVSFASGFDPGTSGLCFARNANLGVFEDGRLVALAYTGRGADWSLGPVEPLEGGALLVWSGDGPSPPVGELRAGEDGLRLTAVAPRRTFCSGRAVVPNVYGKSIQTARKSLIAQGWRPLPPAEAPGEWDGAADLAEAGVVEAESCSGTGVGYCRFTYRGPAGVLAVTTVGGSEPGETTVVGAEVDCRAR